MSRKYFGTDGVRGTANIEPVTAETALRLGRAAGHVFKKLNPKPRGAGRHKIVLGKDTRLSGYMIENALSSGILSMGVDVLFIGPLPTPGVAYVTRSLRADAGIVITASHNPYDDNGIKLFRADGYKLDDNIEGKIEDLVFSGAIETIQRLRPIIISEINPEVLRIVSCVSASQFVGFVEGLGYRAHSVTADGPGPALETGFASTLKSLVNVAFLPT